MKRGCVLLACCVLCVAPALAQWKAPDGRALPDTPWRKHDGDLGAALQIATESAFADFEREWYSTALTHTPALDTTDSAKRGDRVRALVVYSGCAPAAASGACVATLRLVVRKPDGSIYADVPALSLAGANPATPDVVQLSPHSLQIAFEPDDPPGRYRVEAYIEDPSQGAQLALQESIRLLASD